MKQPTTFLYEQDEQGIATITLNRPERLNALTFDVYRELTDTFAALREESAVRVVVITGAGRAFCSGGDVHDIIGELFSRDMEGLLEFLPVRIYSSEVGYRKPDKRIFQAALAQLGVRPGEVLFVGDLVKTDIVGARRMGMTTALKQPFANLRRHRIADHVVRKIADLAQLLPAISTPATGQ